jgi:hypothetical protein
MVTAAGRCPAEGHRLVAADVDGDGSADTWTPFQCRYCGPYLVDTTDLNGDGVDEVIVSEVVFSAPNYRVFTLSPNPQRGVIMETTVGGSGHPGAGLAAGSPMILSAGGDAGISDFIRCEGYPANTVIVQTRTFSPEGRSTTELHITRMRLGSDGIFEILDTFDSTPPAGDPIPGDPGSPRPPACGVDWDPNSV